MGWNIRGRGRSTGRSATSDEAVYLRLRSRDDLSDRLPEYTPLEPLPDLVALAAIDHPDQVEDLTGDLDRIGSYERAVELGLRNLAALPTPDVRQLLAEEDEEASAVYLLISDDFFGASRAIVLEHTLRDALGMEIPPVGAFLVVPNRHLLAVHLPSPGGVGTVAAITALADLARAECDETRGALSPFVYHVTRDGSAAQVSSRDDDGEIAVRIDGQVADAFIALGLFE